MRPTRSTRALEAIMRDLINTRDGATYFAERVWAVSLAYDLGEGSPLIGRSAPNFELINGTKLGEILRDGKGVFLDFDSCPQLQALARQWSGITYIATEVRDRLGFRAIIVRPDGFVAWAAQANSDFDIGVAVESAARSLSRWFGNIEENCFSGKR